MSRVEGKIYILLLLFVAFSACIKTNKPKQQQEKDNYEEQLITVNKYLVNYYQDVIKDYIRHKGWKMDSTGTGLWYEIYYKTDGYVPKDGDKVTIAYKISLLNGKECYNSDTLGLKTFVVNQSDIISGVNEAVQLIPEGSKARLIIPPYLAYGLLGDMKCIPSNAIIVYDLELVRVIKAKKNQKSK